MRRIAIIGAGQAGTLAAVGLMNRGHEVTLYSDRSAGEIFERTAPTGTAYIFADAVACERASGCETFEDVAPKGDGVHLCFLPRAGVELLQVGGRLDNRAGYAVDVRLKSMRRMEQLARGGARVVIERVTPDQLDHIAAAHDLTLVATGKGGLAGLFRRDPARSRYDRPQRQLGMLIVRGVPADPSAFPHRMPGHTPICFNFYGDLGELFWVPYLHKTEGPCWCLLIEARPGGPLDAFASVRSAEEMLGVFRAIIRTYTPWDWQTMKDMELVPGDPMCWLRGSLAPTVREPLGRTPGGRPIMALGDTGYAFDPVAGQGAGCGARQAAHYVDAITARGDAPFDDAWITATAEAFHHAYADGAYRFTNLLLEPLDEVGRLVLISAFAHPGLADAFFQNFGHPPGFFPWIQDRAAARAFVARTTGMSWRRAFARGLAKIARGQLAQRLHGRHFTHG